MIRRPAILLFVGFFLGLGCQDEDGGHTCFPGNENCPCVASKCLAGLECIDGTCEVIGAATDTETTGDTTTSPTGG